MEARWFEDPGSPGEVGSGILDAREHGILLCLQKGLSAVKHQRLPPAFFCVACCMCAAGVPRHLPATRVSVSQCPVTAFLLLNSIFFYTGPLSRWIQSAASIATAKWVWFAILIASWHRSTRISPAPAPAKGTRSFEARFVFCWPGPELGTRQKRTHVGLAGQRGRGDMDGTR